MSRPVVQLHRPWAPDPRAESIQVLAAAHGLARHREVEVLMRRSEPVRVEELLARHGLVARPGLHVELLPGGGTAASLAFWAAVARWWARGRGRGVALARTPRYGLRARRAFPGLRLVAEVHGLADPLLPALLTVSVGAVCNSRGTAEGVRRLAPGLPVATLANASRGPGPAWIGEGEGIGCTGSVRAEKGLEVLARLAEGTEEPVVLVTGDPSAARALGPRLQVEGPLDPAAIPARLARFRCLVVPLAPGPFGAVETCPLKLFDALASGRPLVVADAPTLHDGIVPEWVPRYRMGDVDDLQDAIARAVALRDRFARRPLVRSWDDRGDELHAFLSEVAG